MSEDMRISISSSVKKIEVNDQGEYILLPLGDQVFISGLLNLMRKFSESADEVEKAFRTAGEDAGSVSEAVALNLNTCEGIKTEVDALFKDEVCKKVFGDIVPSLTAFSEFFDKLAPFVKKYSDEKARETRERIKKYTGKYSAKYHKKE